MTDSEKDLAGGSRSCATERGGARSCATEGGGARSCATEGGVVVADARERVPPGLAHGTLGSPAGGSRSCATEGGVVVADARERVPPGLPVRCHPSRNSVMTFHDNRAILLYVTIVTANRMPVLACAAVVECILAAWAAATDWLVGRYVIMPDHIHFFCAPASYPPPDFRRWMAYWKSLSAKAYWRIRGGSRSCATEGGVVVADAQERVPPVLTHATLGSPAGGSRSCATGGGVVVADAQERVPPRNPPLWQRDCWDRQLRTGESYAQKWEYVRNNPVRKGLIANADGWPYQGELNVLEWHERN